MTPYLPCPECECDGSMWRHRVPRTQLQIDQEQQPKCCELLELLGTCATHTPARLTKSSRLTILSSLKLLGSTLTCTKQRLTTAASTKGPWSARPRAWRSGTPAAPPAALWRPAARGRRCSAADAAHPAPHAPAGNFQLAMSLEMHAICETRNTIRYQGPSRSVNCSERYPVNYIQQTSERCKLSKQMLQDLQSGTRDTSRYLIKLQ